MVIKLQVSKYWTPYHRYQIKHLNIEPTRCLDHWRPDSNTAKRLYCIPRSTAKEAVGENTRQLALDTEPAEFWVGGKGRQTWLYHSLLKC